MKIKLQKHVFSAIFNLLLNIKARTIFLGKLLFSIELKTRKNYTMKIFSIRENSAPHAEVIDFEMSSPWLELQKHNPLTLGHFGGNQRLLCLCLQHVRLECFQASSQTPNSVIMRLGNRNIRTHPSCLAAFRHHPLPNNNLSNWKS